MKILQINVFNYRKGGSEVVYFSTMELLRMHGEEVVNFALRWPENYPSEYESYFPESKETRSELLKPVKNIINYCCPVKLFQTKQIRADTSHEVSALLVIFVLRKNI